MPPLLSAACISACFSIFLAAPAAHGAQVAAGSAAIDQAPAANAAQPGADFTGVDAFWRIVDTLQRNEEPLPAAWDELFTTPGYAALEARERRRAALTVALRAAFKPSLEGERETLLAKGDWTSRVIRHVQDLPTQRAALTAFQRDLAASDPLARAVALAATLLPAGVTERYGRPAVAFLFFLPDGRGYPDLIVADLAHLAAKPDVVPFFAHESVHFFHGRLSRSGTLPANRADAGSSALLGLLTKIEEEAIADQFDKIDALTASDAELAARHRDPSWLAYLRDYRSALAGVDAELQRFGASLQAMAGRPPDMPALVAELAASLALEGRPLGMVLAQAIRQQLGDAALATSFADPVRFFALYQQAAQQPSCGCRALSSAAMAVLTDLGAPAGD